MKKSLSDLVNIKKEKLKKLQKPASAQTLFDYIFLMNFDNLYVMFTSDDAGKKLIKKDVNTFYSEHNVSRLKEKDYYIKLAFQCFKLFQYFIVIAEETFLIEHSMQVKRELATGEFAYIYDKQIKIWNEGLLNRITKLYDKTEDKYSFSLVYLSKKFGLNKNFEKESLFKVRNNYLSHLSLKHNDIDEYYIENVGQLYLELKKDILEFLKMISPSVWSIYKKLIFLPDPIESDTRFLACSNPKCYELYFLDSDEIKDLVK